MNRDMLQNSAGRAGPTNLQAELDVGASRKNAWWWSEGSLGSEPARRSRTGLLQRGAVRTRSELSWQTISVVCDGLSEVEAVTEALKRCDAGYLNSFVFNQRLVDVKAEVGVMPNVWRMLPLILG